GCLHLNFELRQFVFFESKQFCASDLLFESLVPKRDVVFAERELLAELERAECTTKSIQCRFARTDFRTARIVNGVFDDLICRSGIGPALRLPRNELPLQRFFRTISRTIGERVDAPAVAVVRCVGITRRERLAIVESRRGEEVSIVRAAFQRKACESVGISRLPQTMPAPTIVHVVTFPKRDARVCDWRTRDGVSEIHERLRG